LRKSAVYFESFTHASSAVKEIISQGHRNLPHIVYF